MKKSPKPATQNQKPAGKNFTTVETSLAKIRAKAKMPAKVLDYLRQH